MLILFGIWLFFNARRLWNERRGLSSEQEDYAVNKKEAPPYAKSQSGLILGRAVR